MAFMLKKDFNLVRRLFTKTDFNSLKINKLKLIKRFYARHKKSFSYLPIDDNNNNEALLKAGPLAQVLEYCKDSRIIYNCYIQNHKFKGPYHIRKKMEAEFLLGRKMEAYENSVPLLIEKINNEETSNGNKYNENIEASELHNNLEQYPYAAFENLKVGDISSENITDSPDSSFSSLSQPSVSEDISARLKAYNERKEKGENFPQLVKHPEDDEELELRFYEDTLLSDLALDNEEIESYVNQHGTPDPTIQKSSVPCGGCGALLHCQDEGLPGYTPSEIFSGKTKGELRAVLCQRCFFLKTHQAALNVRVSPEVYGEALKPIASKRALIMVVVDLIDTPCSIWPGLYNLIGKKQPVVVVGNKIDLLPLDNYNFLKTIKKSLIESIKATSLWKAAIKHVALVSAKSGYGIEDLITQIQTQWGIKGDIYIVGCTNAGKSTLFNALLNSDMCKVKASNLIRRATASPWPGTTLNLLKFPLLRPSGHRLASRRSRLKAEHEKRLAEGGTLSIDKHNRLASLTGYVGQTFHSTEGAAEEADPFKISLHKIPKDTPPRMGIKEESHEYAESRWCYDTPGTVQPDQFLGLLTHDELLDVLPKRMIVPRVFVLHPSQSLFIAGLARLDMLYGQNFIRVAVCCSESLPITLVPTCEASAVYRTYLGTKLLHVPRGTQQRLDRWSVLKPVNVRLKGKGIETAADLVLSSAGFVSVTGKEFEIDLRCWTPGGRGVFLRSPSMLPNAHYLRGKRIPKTPTYLRRELSHLYDSS